MIEMNETRRGFIGMALGLPAVSILSGQEDRARRSPATPSVIQWVRVIAEAGRGTVIVHSGEGCGVDGLPMFDKNQMMVKEVERVVQLGKPDFVRWYHKYAFSHEDPFMVAVCEAVDNGEPWQVAFVQRAPRLLTPDQEQYAHFLV